MLLGFTTKVRIIKTNVLFANAAFESDLFLAFVSRRAGGNARKESTTPEQREAQARKAAQARWGPKKKK